jgi:D-lactate dehydrogenase
MNIYFFEIGPFEEHYIKKNLGEIPCEYTAEPLTQANSHKYAAAEIICIFIHSIITQDVLANLPKLKYILTRSTGVDHIDQASAQERDIQISYVPGYGEHTVAEFTFGLILALSRKIIQGHEQVQKLDFSSAHLVGFDLKNKVIGIVGVGAIGGQVIKIANGFGMHVVAYDPHSVQQRTSELSFRYTQTLEELLQIADIISLHAPYNAHTHHMINQQTLALVKPGAMLINTARGPLIDTQALIQALNTGTLAAAGLDVLECEHTLLQLSHQSGTAEDCTCTRTALAELMLMQRPHVLITPHIAFNSQEALIRILDAVRENIRNYIQERPLMHLVTI